MMMQTSSGREALVDTSNPMQIEGIEYVEYRCARPQALGQVLEQMGFRPVARHRSREVLLYRQGGMNIVVNAHNVSPATDGDVPQIAAVALRVHDAGAAWKRVVDLGAQCRQGSFAGCQAMATLAGDLATLRREMGFGHVQAVV